MMTSGDGGIDRRDGRRRFAFAGWDPLGGRAIVGRVVGIDGRAEVLGGRIEQSRCPGRMGAWRPQGGGGLGGRPLGRRTRGFGVEPLRWAGPSTMVGRRVAGLGGGTKRAGGGGVTHVAMAMMVALEALAVVLGPGRSRVRGGVMGAGEWGRGSMGGGGWMIDSLGVGEDALGGGARSSEVGRAELVGRLDSSRWAGRRLGRRGWFGGTPSFPASHRLFSRDVGRSGADRLSRSESGDGR